MALRMTTLPFVSSSGQRIHALWWWTRENEGVSCTRNAGLILAHGDYIQFVDSDDALDPDYTQNLVQAALQHSADLVIAPYWMVIPPNSTKTGYFLETLQTSLGIEPETPKTEVRKYSFLPEGIYSREDYARSLMQQPASFLLRCAVEQALPPEYHCRKSARLCPRDTLG